MKNVTVALPDLDPDFRRLTNAFEAIAAIPSDLRKQFTLGRIASTHGLSKAEARKFFQLWLMERPGGISND